jgi:toxin CcdB
MAQFSVHKNKNPKTKGSYPYLVDIQSDLLSGLRTRVVVPLVKYTSMAKKSIDTLTPIVDVEGQKFLMLVPQLAGISLSDLGADVASLANQRGAVVAAVDFLVTGI